MFKVAVTVVQQIMTEFNGAVLEEAKIVAITKIVLISWRQMVTRVRKSLEVGAFKSNGMTCCTEPGLTEALYISYLH
jgi:hypothetical protein